MIASQDRSEWIGASDVQYVIGNWKTKTWEKWWLQKLGINQDHFDNRYTLAGTNWEHRILESLHLPDLEMDRQILNENLRLRVNLDGNTPNCIKEVKTYDYARESAQIKELGRKTFSSDWMAEIQGDTAEGILKHVIKENVKNMYLSGDISAEEAIQRRIEYHGDTKEEATEKIAYWDFQVKNPEYADWREDTVTRYKDLDAKTAAHVVDVLGKLSPEDGYSNVRPIQKIEAITKDSSLSDKDKETALRAIMDDNLEAKYDAARKMGIGTSKFATAYRKYQDTEGKGKKAKVVDYYKDAFKLSKSDAEELYDLFAGK